MAKTKRKGIGQGKGGGQPPKYSTKEALQTALGLYFESCMPTRENKFGLLPNKAGACHFLGISRETWSQYAKRFPDAIKSADNMIENAWVQRLGSPGATGAIFYLKNAFKEIYKDRQEVVTNSMTPNDLKDFK